MSESERERVYWWITIACLALAPWTVYSLVAADVTFAWPRRAFAGFIFGSLPLAFLFEIAAMIVVRRPLRFVVKNPTVERRHHVELPTEAVEAAIRQRLAHLGFSVTPSPDGALVFAKRKGGGSFGFLDHALHGHVTLRPAGSGTAVIVSLTLADTALVVTGEQAKLERLADHLAGQDVEPAGRDLTLVLGCGIVLAMVTTVLSATAIAAPALAARAVFASALASAAMLLAGLAITAAKQPRLFGFRVGLLALLAAAVPFVALLPPVRALLERFAA